MLMLRCFMCTATCHTSHGADPHDLELDEAFPVAVAMPARNKLLLAVVGCTYMTRAFLIISCQVTSISPLVFSTSCRRFASNARTAHAPSFRLRPRDSGPPWCVVPFSNFLNAEKHTGWMPRPARPDLCNSHISLADEPLLCHWRTSASSLLLQCGAMTDERCAQGGIWGKRTRLTTCTDRSTVSFQMGSDRFGDSGVCEKK